MVSLGKVLVTGLEGFTGIYLESILREEGYEVYGTSLADSPKPHIFTCNITKRIEIETIVRDICPDFIIHLAAISFVGESNASLIYDVNVIGTENLLEALLGLEKKPQKIILVSSATVYGNQTVEILDETLCPKPINHYGFSKLAMEHLSSTYFDKLPIIITRPFNYIGIGQGEHFLIPKIVSHYQKKYTTIELGNLDVAREFNDVRDIVLWYVDLLQSKSHGEIVNLCSGKAISLTDIIDYMNQLAGYKIDVRVNPKFVRSNEIKTLFGSTNKLTQLTPKRKLKEIKETLAWMYHAS